MVQTDTWKKNDTIKFLKVHGLAIRGRFMLRQGLAIPGFLILKGWAYFPSIQCLNQLDLCQLVNWNFLNLKYIAWKCTKSKDNFEFRILNSKFEMGHLNSEFWIQNSKWDIWIQNSEFKIRNGHLNSEFWIQNSKWDIWIQNSKFKIANGTCEFRILKSNFQCSCMDTW